MVSALAAGTRWTIKFTFRRGLPLLLLLYPGLQANPVSTVISYSTPISGFSASSADSTGEVDPTSFHAPMRASNRARSPYPGTHLLLTLPLLEMPQGYFLNGNSPSMQQSVRTNAAFTQFMDQSIGWAWQHVQQPMLRTFGTWFSLGLFNYLSLYVPPGESWLHEEWHRAVLTHFDISSYNGVYHWDIGTETISVDHVADLDLAALKASHPSDFVRLAEAGIEGEIEGARLMRKHNFFLGRDSHYDQLNWFISAANTTAYIYLCATSDMDQDLLRAEMRESAVSSRDFTGLDFRAWVYDLRRPDEPYADGPRGRTHPSGQGFDRYLHYGDLTPAERRYLKRQAGLSLVNFLSPQLFGWDWLPGTNPWNGQRFLWNLGMIHHLTPFGYDLAADFLARSGKWSWDFSAQAFVNGRMALPGCSGEIFRYPVRLGRSDVYLTGQASFWLQPKDQLFHTRSIRPGAAVLGGAAIPIHGGLEVFGEADIKSPGWVAGNVNLEGAAQGRAGLQLRL